MAYSSKRFNFEDFDAQISEALDENKIAMGWAEPYKVAEPKVYELPETYPPELPLGYAVDSNNHRILKVGEVAVSPDLL